MIALPKHVFKFLTLAVVALTIVFYLVGIRMIRPIAQDR